MGRDRDGVVFGVKDAEKSVARIKVPELNVPDATTQMVRVFQGIKSSEDSFANAQTVCAEISLSVQQVG